MKFVEGKYTSAMIFTDSVEDYALAQIKMICDNQAFEGSKICIMPDVHPGKVGPIGFTATVKDRVLPMIVGIDIGCGMTMAKIKAKRVDCVQLDKLIRERVPAGFATRKKTHRFAQAFDFLRLKCVEHIRIEKAEEAVGTLGGGNHFIEVDKDDEGQLYVIIHSGSRHLGKEIAEYYMKEGQRALKTKGLSVPYELTYLEGTLLEDYLHDVIVAQEYAEKNRLAILDEILQGMKWKQEETYSCIHNYIDTSCDLPVIRKGAISAGAGERVIIPVNMRDGVILGIGKGNAEWNISAPHGAGRVMKREDVKTKYTLSEFKKAMKGIYSTSVSRETLDEAPFAYRGMEEITERIKETVEIDRILRPVYNYKAG